MVKPPGSQGTPWGVNFGNPGFIRRWLDFAKLKPPASRSMTHRVTPPLQPLVNVVLIHAAFDC
jgi:hypothetical protein